MFKSVLCLCVLKVTVSVQEFCLCVYVGVFNLFAHVRVCIQVCFCVYEYVCVQVVWSNLQHINDFSVTHSNHV